MKITTIFFIVTILFFPFVEIVKADIAPPTRLTTFYFQKDGQPFTQPVKFTIKCYGTDVINRDISSIFRYFKSLKISEFSETCQTYGCKYDTSNVFEAYRQNTKYCDLEGEVNGEKFTAKGFISANISGLNCHRPDYTMSTGDKYYKETPKYKSCMDAVYKEYYPDNKNYICDKFLVEVPKSECKGAGYDNTVGNNYTIIDNICYKSTNETHACIDGRVRKENLCEQYYEDVTSKLAKDKNGYSFEEICETKIKVPANISSKQQPQNVEPTSSIEQPQSTLIINFFRCSFLKLFGKSC